MKTIEKRMRAHDETTEVICDICGKMGKFGRWSDSYSVEQVELYYRSGESYPEGGSGETILADICPKCFIDKVVPALEAVGCKFRTEEWDTY